VVTSVGGVSKKLSSEIVVVRPPGFDGFKELPESKAPHMVATSGYLAAVPLDIQLKIIEYAASHISAKTSWVVFKPLTPDLTEHYEDGGRTIVRPLDGIKETIYAILDDHETKENLSSWCGQKVDTQYLLTFLLAQEY
jgi:hypothetical protein